MCIAIKILTLQCFGHLILGDCNTPTLEMKPGSFNFRRNSIDLAPF